MQRRKFLTTTMAAGALLASSEDLIAAGTAPRGYILKKGNN